jgi:Polyketide cyclase / dehydrase and lipid transport
MAPIIETIEVGRPPGEVFSYVTDPSRFGEWQKNVVGGHMDDGPTRVGSKCITRRRIGFAERPVTPEVTRIDTPKTWAVRGIDGPIRARVDVAVEPLDARKRCKITIALDFEGRGIGKVLVPLAVRREARKEMPDNLRKLKERVESGAT